MIKDQQIQHHELVNGMLIALVFSMSVLTRLLSLIVRIPYNIVIMEIIIASALIIINDGVVLTDRPFILMQIIVLFIFGSSALASGVDEFFIHRVLTYIMYGLLPSFCIQYEFDIKIFRRTLVFCGIPLVLYLFLFAARQLETGMMSIDETMDLSYTALIPSLAAIWTLWDRDKFIYRIISIAALVPLVYFMAIYSANRGALIALLCFLVFLLLQKISNPILRFLMVTFFAVSGILIYSHLEDILKQLQKLASDQGVTIKALNKMLYELESQRGVGGGRLSHYGIAFQLMKENLFFPGGVGCFYHETGLSYPHNMLVEIELEIGPFATAFCVCFIVYVIWKILHDDVNSAHFLSFFFCLSFVRLMMSSTIWENFYFWGLIVFVFMHKDSLQETQNQFQISKNEKYKYII